MIATLPRRCLSRCRSGSQQSPGRLLEGDQHIAFEIHRELFGHCGVVAINHSGNHEQTIVELLDLGPLVDVDHILDHQGVQVVHVGESSQGRFAPESDDIDPNPLVGGRNRIELEDIAGFLFEEILTQGDDVNDGWCCGPDRPRSGLEHLPAWICVSSSFLIW